MPSGQEGLLKGSRPSASVPRPLKAAGGSDAPDGRGVALTLEGIRRSFDGVVAVDSIDLRVQRGCFLTLLGPSGCGKTTLLRIIAGLERADRGRVVIADRDVTGHPPERRPVNYVFQGYALFPHLDVAANIGFGLSVAGVAPAEFAARVDAAIAMVRLTGLERRRVEQLSGGQQQRVALARAIVNQPAILLLDEPLGALDLQLRKQMQLELRQLHRRLAGTFVYVTHDQEEALALSDRIVVLRDGRVEQDGPPAEIYRRPASRFVAQFIGQTNLFDALAGAGGVALNRLPLQLPLDPQSVVGAVVVSIRPEQMWLTAEGIGERRDVATLAGVLRDSIFLGSFTRHLVELPNGQSVLVQEHGADAHALEPGAAVRVAWHIRDAMVLGR